MLKQYLNKIGVRRKDFRDRLGVTLPTVYKYLTDPKTMNGYQREKLYTWDRLRLDACELDSLINGDRDMLITLLKRFDLEPFPEKV